MIVEARTRDGTDEALFERFRDSQDESALRALLDRHWAGMYRLALALVHDPAAAEDVAQEACIRVVEAARRKKSLSPFTAWLRRVVLNEARTTLRSRARREKHEAASAAEPRPVTAPADPGAALREYTDRLPEKLGLPLILHYGLGYTHEEIAGLVGCRKGTAASRIRYGLERLTTLAVAGASQSLVEIVGLAKVPSAPELPALLARAAESARRSAVFGTKAFAVYAGTAVVLVAAAVLAGEALLPDSSPSKATVANPGALEHGPKGRETQPTEQGSRSEPVLDPAVPAAESIPAKDPAPASLPRKKIDYKPSPVVLAAIASLEDDERAPPPYPWPETPETDVTDALDRRRVTLNFESATLAEAFDYLEELGCPKMSISPNAAELIEANQIKVTLKLREITLRNTINLLLACSGNDDLIYLVSGDGLQICLKNDVPPPLPPARRARAPGPVTLSKHDIDQWALEWSDDEERKTYTNQRDAFQKKISGDFPGSPLSELVKFLQDVSKLKLGVSKGIDADQVTVELRFKDVPVQTVLDRALKQTGLARVYKHEGLLIVPVEECQGAISEQLRRKPELSGASEETVAALARGMIERGEFGEIPERFEDRRVSLDLRGVNVSELRGALESLGIKTYATEESWDSQGTFSVIARDEPLGALVCSLPRGTNVRGLVNGRLLLHEPAPSVRRALTAPLPPFEGAAAEVVELREQIAKDLSERKRLRAAKDVAPADLYETELTVSRRAQRVLRILERSTGALSAPGEKEELGAKLTRTRADLDAAKSVLEARKRALPEAQDSTQRYRDECSLAKPRNAVRLLEARLAEQETALKSVEERLATLALLEAGKRLD